MEQPKALKNKGKINFILGELQSVIVVLHLQGNWKISLNKFKEVQERIRSCKDLTKLDSTILFECFLNLIKSKRSSCSLLKVVLDAISNLINESVLTSSSLNAAETINSIIRSILQSKFADIDRSEIDEIAELSILECLLTCLNSSLKSVIEGDLIIDITQRCVAMISQTRSSDVFVVSAEKIFDSMINSIIMDNIFQCIEENKKRLSQSNSNDSEHVIQVKKGLLVVHKLMKYLCSLIKSKGELKDQIVQVSILNFFHKFLNHHFDCLEELPSIIFEIIRDDLCKALLGGLKSNSVHVFSRILRIFSDLFASMKVYLKFQIELFFKGLITHILENKLAPLIHQELALEMIVELCTEPSFITSLYINFDCDLYCSNTLEILCRYMYKNAFPVSGELDQKHLLSLEGLQAIMQSIAIGCTRFEGPIHSPITRSGSQIESNNDTKSKYRILNSQIKIDTPPELFKEMKRIKELVVNGINTFNKNPKEGLKFLQDNHLLDSPLQAEQVAEFFLNNLGLDKTKLGDFFGERNEFNEKVLQHFISGFVNEYQSEVDHFSLVNTIRAFLESFRLPREAQKISRIFEYFAQIYYNFHKDKAKNFPFNQQDEIFIMCYSIILLHTDQHSSGVRKKMTVQEYVKSTREPKETNHLSQELLENIYYNIRDNEIKLPDDHPNEDITDNAWQTILRRSNRCQFIDSSLTTNLAAISNREIFSIIWGPVIAALSVVFDTTMDENIIHKTLNGFNSCALISAHYSLSDVFDNLVISICKFSTLSSMPSTDTLTILLNFGNNVKVQLATASLFDIIRQFGSHLKEGWKNILDCLISLYQLKLLPPSLVYIPNILEPENVAPQKVQKEEQTSYLGYLFSSSWFKSEPEKPSEQEEQARNTAQEIINKCNIKEIFENTKNLEPESLGYLIKAIILASSKSPKEKDQEVIFYLNLLTTIALQNAERIVFLWILVNDYFNALILGSSGKQLRQAVANLMYLCHTLLPKTSTIQDQVLQSLEVLHFLSQKEKFLEKITFGINTILEKNSEYILTEKGWKIIFSFLEPSTTRAIYSLQFSAVSKIIEKSSISVQNVNLILNTLFLFTKLESDITIAVDSIKLISQILTQLPMILGFKENSTKTSFDKNNAWESYWMPSLINLSFLWKNSHLQIRQIAVVALQESVRYLSDLEATQFLQLFEKVIFPLLSSFISRENVDIKLLEELRLHGIQLFSKAFLQYLQDLSHVSAAEFKSMWIKVLHIISLFMNESSENLKESIKESLKNILLVMSVSGIFQPRPPNTPRSDLSPEIQIQKENAPLEQDIWDLSWATIQTFCPSLKDDLLLAIHSNHSPLLTPKPSSSSSDNLQQN